MTFPVRRSRKKKDAYFFSLYGFTFIEMCLVISILAVIGYSVFNTLNNGLKIWDRAYRLIIEEDVALFFDKINVDLRNVIPYSLIRFDGDPDRISFATRVFVRGDSKKNLPKDAYVDEIGCVEYYFDKAKGYIYRRQANYSQALKNKFAEKRLLVSKVESLTFQYLYKTNKGYVIKKEGEGIAPSLVTIKIEFGDDAGRLMEKIVRIPASF